MIVIKDEVLDTLFKKKSQRMRIMGACIKVFRRETYAILTRCYLQNNNKNWRMRILSAPYFSKYFGGKMKIFLEGCYLES